MGVSSGASGPLGLSLLEGMAAVVTVTGSETGSAGLSTGPPLGTSVPEQDVFCCFCFSFISALNCFIYFSMAALTCPSMCFFGALFFF